MSIYDAAKAVKNHFSATIGENIVQTTAIYGYCQGEVIKFKTKQEAAILNKNDGYLFECMYRNGEIDVTPFT